MDSHLFPENSPISQNQGQTSSFAFDYQNDAGIINRRKIQNLAVGSAQIGTAAIGSAQIGTAAVQTANIATAAVGSAQIATAAVGSLHVQDASITDAKIVSLAVSKILAGTLTVGINVGTASGGAYVLIDGANNRIVVNDGTNNRIVIGNV